MIRGVAAIRRLDDLRCTVDCAECISGLAPGITAAFQVLGLHGVLFQIGFQLRLTEPRSLAPGDVKRLLSPFARFVGIGHDRYAPGQPHDVGHTVDRSRRSVVDLHGLFVLDRRAQHGRVDHARHLDVDPELGAAVGLRLHVQSRDIRAHVAVVAEGLQFRVLDLRERVRRLGERNNLSVRQPTPRGRVHDHAGLCLDLGNGNAPLVGGRLHQQLSRLRAATPQLVEVSVQREAAGRVKHVLEELVSVGRVMDGYGLHHDVVPVGVHLVSENYR